MSKVLFYLPANTRHSNVQAGKRREYIENIGAWLNTLRGAGFPVSTSFQRDCLDLLGLTEKDFDGIELLSAPGNHLLPSRFEKHPTMKHHARAMLRDAAVVGNVPGYFMPEFDIPRTDLLAPGFQILFALPGQTVLYSECSTSDVERGTPLENYEAIRFLGDKVVVPMLGVEGMQKAFFLWQRFKTTENLAALLAEIRKVTEDGEDRVRVFFLDLEAPLVGSHHGLDIWRELFAAIVQSGLAEHFVSFHEAAAHWQSRAVKIEGPTWTLFARQLGTKWTGLQPQMDYLDRVMLAEPPRTLAEHKWLAFCSTSDILSAMDRKLRGNIVIDGDLGKLTIGYDQTIMDLAFKMLDAYEHGMSSVATLRGLLLVDSDAQWFVNRCVDTLKRYGF